jgi:hypothetical protein
MHVDVIKNFEGHKKGKQQQTIEKEGKAFLDL